MRLAYGEGVIVAILAPIIVFLFGIGKITPLQTAFLVFLLLGVWTLIAAFALMAQKDRIYYFTWGLILASISSAFITHIQYAIALILLAIVVALFVNVATRRNPPKSSSVQQLGQGTAGSSP